jgi:23S rRNA (uridine2552-2'-O)-methyltransferase
MKKSNPWLNQHLNDEYVKKSKQQNYRSRAAYKLIEVITKHQFIKQDSYVLDLGAAPGSWSQVVSNIIGKNGKIIANDILDIEPIKKVEFLLGDFTDEDVYNQLLKLINNNKIDVVLSDMSPNLSGHPSIDMPKSMYLCELTINIAVKILQQNGYLFMKVFQGSGFDDIIRSCKNYFNKVTIQKPKASRAKSKEIYLLANQLK